MQPNPYEVLGVSTHAPDFVIRAAYHAGLKRYHPDKYSGSDASERTSAIVEAWRILSSPEEKRKLDERLAQNPRDRGESHDKNTSNFSSRGSKPEDRTVATVANSEKATGIWVVAAGALVAFCIIMALSRSDSSAAARIEAEAETVEVAADAAMIGYQDLESSIVVEENPFNQRPTSDTQDIFEPLKVQGLRFPKPAVNFTDIERGARKFVAVFEQSGMAGARSFSEECRSENEVDQTWERTDFCVAFDIAADSFDGAASRTLNLPRNAYFQFRAANLADDYGRFSSLAIYRVNSIRPAARQVVTEELGPSLRTTQAIPTPSRRSSTPRAPTLGEIENDVRRSIETETGSEAAEEDSEVDAHNPNTSY